MGRGPVRAVADELCAAGVRPVLVGSGSDVYEEPATAWVADFLGVSNMMEGRADGHTADGACRVRVGDFEFRAERGDVSASGPVKVVIRPERVVLVPGGDDVLPVAQFDKAAGVICHLNEHVRVGKFGKHVDPVCAIEDNVLIVAHWCDERRIDHHSFAADAADQRVGALAVVFLVRMQSVYRNNAQVRRRDAAAPDFGTIVNADVGQDTHTAPNDSPLADDDICMDLNIACDNRRRVDRG